MESYPYPVKEGQRYINLKNLKYKSKDNITTTTTRILVTISARITGGTGVGFPPPTAVVGPHVIHGVEVSALSVPRCRPPLLCLSSTTGDDNNNYKLWHTQLTESEARQS